MRRVGIVLLIAMLAVSTGNVYAEDTKGSDVNAKGISLDVVTSIPRTMTYQGILKDSEGNPVGNGNYSITFRIYDAATDGNLLWMEGVTVATTGGIFTAQLGNTTSLDLPFDTDYYLSIQVLGDSEMADRQRITMSAYSARTDTSAYAINADLLDGYDSGDFAIVGHDHDAEYVNEGQPNAIDGSMVIDGSLSYLDIADGSGSGLDADLLDGLDSGDFLSTDSDYGRPNVATDLYEGSQILTDLYVNEGQTGSITSDMIIDGDIQFGDIGQNAATVDQVMKWNGSAWVVSDDEIGAGGGGWVDDGTVVRLETITDNVGIGTASPGTYKLNVNGTGYFGDQLNIMDPNYYLQLSGNDARILFDSGSDWFRFDRANNAYDFIIAADKVFSAEYASQYLRGNVGIGTLTPSEKLDVAGTAQMTGFKMPTGASNGYILTSNASGVGTWQAAGAGSNWSVTDSVLFTDNYWGIARGGAGNVLYGDSAHTMINLGAACTTGTSGQNYPYSTVSGGQYNAASGHISTVGGGAYNTASHYSTVGGGVQNTAGNTLSTVGGGMQNTASHQYSTVGGGQNNTASGQWSTVGGGYYNTASGHYSFAAGRRAKANHNGAFVWADQIDADFASTGDNQFLIRAGGGVGINTNSPGAALHIGGTAGVDGIMFPDGTLQTTAITGGNWTVTDSVLYTNDYWGIARGGAGNVLYGDSAHTMINLGVSCTTGTSGQNVYYSTVSGGQYNAASGSASTVGGGYRNTASHYSTVGGGHDNTASNTLSTVGGGHDNTASDYASTVGGGQNNTASNTHSTVGGGLSNTASGERSTVGGGNINIAGGDNSTVGGGWGNTASTYAAAVGGGQWNRARGQYSVVSGGGGATEADSNSAIGDYSAIGGGRGNTASGYGGTVGGGHSNTASNTYSTVGGGWQNTTTYNYSTVGGGAANTASADASTVAGGTANTASNAYSTVGGGAANTASGQESTVGGGSGNTASNTYSTVGGGWQNTATYYYSTVGGGAANTASGEKSIVGGGQGNTASGLWATVGGGYHNTASGEKSTVCGGRFNKARGQYAVVSGGGGSDEADSNSAIGDYSAIGGGRRNIASGGQSTIGGGGYNTASGNATVGGGGNNHASGDYSTVGGGYSNTASGNSASTVGGAFNTASGSSATVAGGQGNTVSGQKSTVGGGYENSNAGDYSVIPGGDKDTLTSLADYSMAFGNQVYVNNSYRVVFFDGTYHGRLGLNRDDHDGGISHPIHVGTNASNGNGARLTSGGTWTNGSSRTFKENFQSLDGQQLLSKISSMQVDSWNFKDSDERHIGPVAEDFEAAFDVGAIRESDGQRENKYLAASDVAGVALAGVQALLDKIEQLEARITELETEKR